MVKKSYYDSVGWIVCLCGIFLILINGRASANKEGYYGKYIGKLSQLHHGVSGDVFAVDARTLHLRNFNYDGEGPAAYFYAGYSKAPGGNGFRLRDERGTTNVLPKYRNKHITITFPEGKTLQNVRWFSVWCDEFSVNFGDVKIPKNLDFPKPQKISGLSGVHGVSSEPIVIVDAQTLLIPSFSYDGEAPDAKFWVGQGLKPSPQGIRIPDENGKELPLRRYDRKTIVLTLPGDLTIFDIGHFGVWCEAFTVDFGHVQIPRGLNIPPSLKMLGVSPQSKLNCEVLWDDFAYEVRWAVAGDSIVLQLVARLENNEYMSFGLSGDRSRSRMVGGDVVVAWVDKENLKGYAKDYYLDAKSQCSGGRGSCPDENIEAGADSVRLLNAALVNGYSIVTFQRSLKAQDDFDQDVFTNASQPVIWAVGPLNSRKEVSYHSLANRGDIFINFGRAPKWNCPTPESPSDHSEPEISSLSREYEEAKIQNTKIQDSSVRDSQPKSQIPTPAPASKTTAWEIPSIKCYEPEDGVFYAQMGPTGGKHGYSAITGHVGWGISWYINGLLIPEINVVRGRTYTFIVEGGLDPETPARYHPFYITDDPIGGYQYKTPEERTNIQIFAGAVQNKRGEVRPTGVGRLCNWTPDPNAPPADEFTSFGAYQRTLRLECDPGNPGIIQWTVEKETPNTVYYQCYTHRYLGWKINVHDSCEGEAASNLVPSIAKPPTGITKPYEMDYEGSESVNFETKVKLDAEISKNISDKYQMNFGGNELVSYGATSKYFPQFHEGELKFLRNDFGVRTGIIRPEILFQIPSQNFHSPDVNMLVQQQKLNIPQSSFALENSLVKFSASTLPSKLSGYSVTEETLEGSAKEQNFHIIPETYTQHSQSVNGLQKHQNIKGGESFDELERLKNENKFQEEHFKNRETFTAHTEGKPKHSNQKLTYHNRFPSNPNRLPKPLPSNPVTLQQRPLPPAVFRPPSLSQKSQKRPVNLGSHKIGHLVPKKSQHSDQRVNIAFDAENFNRQETQLFHQIRRPHKKQPNSFSAYDLFSSSVVDKLSSLNTPFVKNNGFDPQSVQVEGGFKPILNTGTAPKLTSSFIDKADTEIAEDADDMIGVIDLFTSNISSKKNFLIKKAQENLTAEKSVNENEENKDKETQLFKNQKLQTFEPVFVPSYPDEGIKKLHEKFKKKPILSLKPRYDEFQHYSLQNGGQVYVKIRPSVSIVRRPLYPDNVVPSFKLPHQGEKLQFRFQESDNSDEGNFAAGIKYIGNHSSTRNFKDENILGILEIYQEKSNKSEANGTTKSEDFISNNKYKSDENVQDEIAVANEKKNFYLPPNADEFRSYDGKIVKAIEAPTLPQGTPSTDISKLPQFVPFKGAAPPLFSRVNAKNLPQLRTSKLARHDILPPSNSSAESAILKVSSHFQNYKTQERKKRSPDHMPGHEEYDHDHHHHQHHHVQHNAGSCGPSSLWQAALINFSLMCLLSQSVFNFFNIRDHI